MRSSSAPQRHIEIGGRIRAQRLKRKLRQVDLAETAGLSWRHLIRIEQGEGGEPKPDTLDRLADALGVDTSDLTGDDEPEPRSVALPDHTEMLAMLALAFEPFLPNREQVSA